MRIYYYSSVYSQCQPLHFGYFSIGICALFSQAHILFFHASIPLHPVSIVLVIGNNSIFLTDRKQAKENPKGILSNCFHEINCFSLVGYIFSYICMVTCTLTLNKGEVGLAVTRIRWVIFVFILGGGGVLRILTTLLLFIPSTVFRPSNGSS